MGWDELGHGRAGRAVDEGCQSESLRNGKKTDGWMDGGLFASIHGLVTIALRPSRGCIYSSDVHNIHICIRGLD